MRSKKEESEKYCLKKTDKNMKKINATKIKSKFVKINEVYGIDIVYSEETKNEND